MFGDEEMGKYDGKSTWTFGVERECQVGEGIAGNMVLDTDDH